uniref:RING-type E3 ubiquitin transferase n=1 Tax=Branchiostoma floridae TaxID=7739 RepID=C3ZRG4_BRAFL|eukprot:XP_002588753.1 hypothetical protein BRAFLDRAFT_89820 [Branchiostoma floridae]
MAAAPSALGTHIREELTCSICLELFTRPKVLPCQHTFCQDCLQDHAGRGGAFRCPNCRQQVRLPHQGVAGLPDNHLVSSLCATLQKQATLSGETAEVPRAENLCNFHPSEKLKLYCKPCQIPICELCLEEAHDDHYTTTINKAAQERRSTVQALINEGRNILESYCGFIKGLGEEEKTLIKQIEQNKNSIIQTYDQRVQKLTEQKDQLLAEAEQSQRKNLETIGNGRDRVLRDVNELSAACDRAEQEMEQGGLVLLSQDTVLTEVVGKYRVKAAPTPVQTQSAVFQPTDTPVPVLGHVMPQPLTSAAIPTVPAAKVRSQHHGNQMLGGHWCQRVTFGGEGSGTVGQQQGMMYPRGIATDGEGNILLSDWDNHCVFVYNEDGHFLFKFGGRGSGEGQLYNPHGICTDREGNIIVADSGNSRVEMFDKTGRFLKHIGTDMEAPLAVAMAAQESREVEGVPTTQTGAILHIAARQSPYFGTKKKRFPVFDKYVPWKVLFVEYDPPRYTAPMEYFSEWFRQFADEVDPSTQKPAPVWNEVVGYKMQIWREGEGGEREQLEEVMEVDRRSWIEDKDTGVGIRYNITSEGVPQNPMGRTGLRGKGALFRWGPNHSMLAICTRWKHAVDPATGDEQEEYLLVEGKRVLEFLSYKEPDFEEWAIPGAMTAGLESKYSVLHRAFSTKALGKQPAVVDRHMDESKVKQLFEAYTADERDCAPSERDDPIETFSAAMIYRGYVDDPRNTDSAWVETEAWHFHYESGESFLEEEMVVAGSRWQEVSRHVKLFASHASVIQEAAERLNAYF